MTNSKGKCQMNNYTTIVKQALKGEVHLGRTVLPDVQITPDDAVEILGANIGNRQVSWRTVERYRAEMERGSWVNNGAPIIISADGRVLDGQHRLEAVVKSGVTGVFDVSFGVDPKVFDRIDVGRARTSGAIMQMAGMTHGALKGSVVSTIIRVEFMYRTGMDFETCKPSRHDILERAQNIGDILDPICSMIEKMRRGFKKLGSAGGVGAAAYFITGKHGWKVAEEFFDQAATGVGVNDEHDAVAVYRRFIITKAQSSKVDANPQVLMTAASIKAFNAWKNGRKMRLLSYKHGEIMPVVEV